MINHRRVKTNVGSSASVVILRDVEKITIRDSLDPVATKERPKSTNMIKSEFEYSLS